MGLAFEERDEEKLQRLATATGHSKVTSSRMHRGSVILTKENRAVAGWFWRLY